MNLTLVTNKFERSELQNTERHSIAACWRVHNFPNYLALANAQKTSSKHHVSWLTEIFKS